MVTSGVFARATGARALAVAESVWSPRAKKNWNHFFGKVETHFTRFDEREVKYAPSVYDPIFTVKAIKDTLVQVTLSTEVEGLDIYYSFDNSFPDRFYPKSFWRIRRRPYECIQRGTVALLR